MGLNLIKIIHFPQKTELKRQPKTLKQLSSNKNFTHAMKKEEIYNNC